MAEIRFYHLQKQKPLQALAFLTERARSRDQIILISAKDKVEADSIDSYLWTYQSESFLDHSLETDSCAGKQKILIALSNENKNNAKTLFQLNRDELHIPDGISLCCKIFDGGNDAEIAAARSDWKRLKELGHELSYWQQDDEGKWSQKA